MTRSLILFVGSLCLSALLFAQVPRLVLVEEFTNASCGPCAGANPALNTLLDNNASKVVALKYQTVFPGTDPMNAQTQSTVASRVSYYGVNGVPFASMDGLFRKHPAYISQFKLDSAQAIPSPFKLELSHQFSDDMDSVFIECTFTCMVTVPGSYVLHVALTEEEIHFNTAPGSNGETVFHDVMRKMFPSASGTAMAATLINAGQSKTFTFAEPLPSFIYDNNQLRTVAFVQETMTKAIGQAAYSSVPLRTDAAVLQDLTFSPTQCGNPTFSIPFLLKNAGLAPLKSVNVSYSIDNGTPMSIASGIPANAPLAPGASSGLSVPVTTFSPGEHTIVIRTSNPNQKTDDTPANDSTVITFVVTGAQASAPFADDFTTAGINPSKYVIMNPSLDNAKWEYNSLGNVNAGSVRFPFFVSPAGSRDELFLPPVTVGSGATFSFDYAHGQYTFPGGQFFSTDTCTVLASTDCGANWTVLWDKSGAALATAASVSGEFTPSAADWKNQSISLEPYAGQNVLIKFLARSNYGNHLYIDNLNITSATAIAPAFAASLVVTPNPARDLATASFALETASTVSATLVNAIGQAVISLPAEIRSAGNQQVTIHTAALAAGVYTLRIQADNATAATRLVIVK